MRLPILLASFLFFLNSCSEKCNCTLIGCPCSELTITVKANTISNSPLGFDATELDSFYILLTDLNFNTIDSLKLEFSINGDGSAHNRVYYIQGQNFSNFQGFKNHNFILKNHSTIYTDSISTISFDETMESRLCNQCSPCDDQYVTCTKYSNPNLERNGISQNNFEIVLINQ